MDRKSWFIDFAKIAGRKNLHAYFVGVIKSILCCNYDDAAVVREIRNATESLDEASGDESLPWDVTDAKKPSAPTEDPKEISHVNSTIDVSKVESLIEPWTDEEIIQKFYEMGDGFQ